MKDKTKQPSIHDALTVLLEKNLDATKESHNITSLNLYACTCFYQAIFNTVVDVIQQAKLKLSNETVNYIAQQYYDGTLINGKHELDPNIFTERAKLDKIKTEELISLCAVFRGTDFVKPVIAEVKKRN